ncbi:cingulin-like [Phyllobates terribilis]|uniref:cingulin-like n=1 Tax=Phyllobates terribilis TaxID=111132 RepID=UPI003CCA8557
MEEEVTLPVATSGIVPDNKEDQEKEWDAVLQIRYKQDDLLRQKDQEPTALKGALKEEVANPDQKLEPIRQQYQSDVQQLRKNMENVSQDQLSLESERQKISQVVRNLQRELEESSEEINKWKEMFQKNKEDLRKTKEEVFQLKLDKVEFEDELYEMKDRFSLVQSELNRVKKGSVDAKEVQRFQDQVKSLMLEKEQLEDSLYQQDGELSALKGALKDEVCGHDQDLEQLRKQFNCELCEYKKEYDEHVRELQQTKRDCEDLLKVKKKLEDDKADAEHMRRVIETTLRGTSDENGDLRRKILGLEAQVKELKTFCDDLQRVATCLKDRIGRMEAEQKKMEESIGEATDQGQEFATGEGRYETNTTSNNASLDDSVDTDKMVVVLHQIQLFVTHRQRNKNIKADALSHCFTRGGDNCELVPILQKGVVFASISSDLEKEVLEAQG